MGMSLLLRLCRTVWVIQYVEWLYTGFIPYAHIHSTEKRGKAFVGNLRFCNLWKNVPQNKRSLVWVPFLSGYSDVAWTHNLLIEKGSQVLQMAHKSHFCFFLVIIFGVPYPTDSTERFLHVDQKRKYCYESFWKKKDGNIQRRFAFVTRMSKRWDILKSQSSKINRIMYGKMIIWDWDM